MSIFSGKLTLGGWLVDMAWLPLFYGEIRNKNMKRTADGNTFFWTAAFGEKNMVIKIEGERNKKGSESKLMR